MLVSKTFDVSGLWSLLSIVYPPTYPNDNSVTKSCDININPLETDHFDTKHHYAKSLDTLGLPAVVATWASFVGHHQAIFVANPTTTTADGLNHSSAWTSAGCFLWLTEGVWKLSRYVREVCKQAYITVIIIIIIIFFKCVFWSIHVGGARTSAFGPLSFLQILLGFVDMETKQFSQDLHRRDSKVELFCSPVAPEALGA